jgi:hypothetical protein
VPHDPHDNSVAVISHSQTRCRSRRYRVTTDQTCLRDQSVAARTSTSVPRTRQPLNDVTSHLIGVLFTGLIRPDIVNT